MAEQGDFLTWFSRAKLVATIWICSYEKMRNQTLTTVELEYLADLLGRLSCLRLVSLRQMARFLCLLSAG